MNRLLLLIFATLSFVVACAQTDGSKRHVKVSTSQSSAQRKNNNSGKSSRANANNSVSTYNVPKKITSGTINNHDWVDLGLSVKWATCNLGALVPEDCGDYIIWGEIKDKKKYWWGDCSDCIDPYRTAEDTNWKKYRLGGRRTIFPNSGDDAARENWGGAWRMPTAVEFDELCKRCIWTHYTVNRVSGYKVVGPNGNSIFLPFAGYFVSKDTNPSFESGGYYWTSDLSSSEARQARSVVFSRYESNSAKVIDRYRSYGQSIRPVIE